MYIGIEDMVVPQQLAAKVVSGFVVLLSFVKEMYLFR